MHALRRYTHRESDVRGCVHMSRSYMYQSPSLKRTAQALSRHGVVSYPLVQSATINTDFELGVTEVDRLGNSPMYAGRELRCRVPDRQDPVHIWTHPHDSGGEVADGHGENSMLLHVARCCTPLPPSLLRVAPAIVCALPFHATTVLNDTVEWPVLPPAAFERTSIVTIPRRSF